MNATGDEDVRALAERLRVEGRPYVTATVVRAERPTSAHAGDTAVVLDDGTIVGFVGGECAEASVQAQALAALRSSEPVLLSISPHEGPAPAAAPGVVHVHNPCLSGGAMEIFLEPHAPPGVVVVHGRAPIAGAVGELARWLGFEVRAFADDALEGDVVAVIVASHGGDEREVLEAALRRGVPYVALVASVRRAEGVLATLDVDDADRGRISTPAGLDIGARTPGEVAVSVLAELVARRPRQDLPPAQAGGTSEDADATGEAAALAVDPVCGMTVAAVDATRHVDIGGRRAWFCGSGCEQAYTADPAAYAN